MRWSDAELARLRECATPAEMRAAFPDRKLATVTRKHRDMVAEGDAQSATGPRGALGQLAELCERSGIDLSEIERVDKLELGEWDMGSKNADGEPEVTRLTTSRIVLTPKFAAGPAWPVVQPAPPVVVQPAPARKKAKRSSEWRTAVILPDPQIGFRRDLDAPERLDPFHDEAAINVALQVVADVEPDLIINLGDLLDLQEFSRFEIEPGFALTTQPSIYRAQGFLCAQRAAAPNAEIRLMEGNHDARLPRQIVANAKAAFSLKRAPDEWPVLSVPNLLRLDDFGVEYVAGYPAGITWVNDRLACVHGSKVRSSGSSAAAVIDDERVSVIFGHIHRIELQHKTRRTRNGGRSSLAASPGCLCRIDGAVPSTKGATDPHGRAVAAVENWQHGLAVVTYKDGDAPFSLELVPIHAGATIFRGTPIEAAA